MITEKKLNIYRKYKGVIDDWSRLGKPKGKSFMTDQDWYDIESMIQNIKMINQGKVAPEYKERLDLHLAEACDNEQTITAIQQMAEECNRPVKVQKTI